MKKSDDTVTLHDVECIGASAKAMYILYGGKKLWVPYTVVHQASRVHATGDRGDLVVSAFWVRSTTKLAV